MAGVGQFAFAQLAQKIDAAAVRQPHVEQQQIGAFGRRPGFSDASCQRHRIALALQDQS